MTLKGAKKTVGGRHRKMVSIGEDKFISEFNNRIAVLQQSLEEINSVPTGIFEIDFYGPRFVSVNGYVCQVLGYTREELLSMGPFDLLDNESKVLLGERIRNILAGEKIDGLEEYRCRTKDGRLLYWVFKVAFTYSKGVPGGAIAIGNESTESKLAENLFETSGEILRAAFEQSAVGLANTTLDGELVWYNKKLCGILGYTLEELSKLTYKEIIYPDDLEEILWNRDMLLAGEVQSYSMEKRYVRKDGSTVWVNLTVSPLYKNGKPEYLINVIEDITKRKQTEDKLKAARQQAELYLDVMGHDINNIHQIALGYLELVSNVLTSEEQADFINSSMNVLQRGTQLIQNVRKLQKLYDGSFPNVDIDVIPVLLAVQREYGAHPNKRVLLNVNGYEHCYVKANGLLHDVYANLVTNAIKHTGDKTDIIMDLDIIKYNGVKYCHVMVEDNGPGIPDDIKAMIFNRTLKNTSKTRGMGLGLYIVKTLVDNFGGKVWVEDRVPDDYTKGARFVVLLPAVEK